MKDLFIRRLYTHKGISVAVDIDLIKKTVSLVEKMGNGNFQNKKWVFADRELRYMNGWFDILAAMAHAIQDASKELQKAENRDEQEFVELLIALDATLDSKSGK